MKQAQGLAWLIRVWVAVAVVMSLTACALVGEMRPKTPAEIFAEAGDPKGQVIVGETYERGSFLRPQNYERAAYWYRKAAEQGHQEAQLRLATLYEEGLGVERNLDQARDWYRKAAALSKDRDASLPLCQTQTHRYREEEKKCEEKGKREKERKREEEKKCEEEGKREKERRHEEEKKCEEEEKHEKERKREEEKK